MELIAKPRTTKKELNRDERYQYSYKVKNGKIVEFFGSDEVKKYFDIHHYCKGGTIYYRKR
jgi:hypothetical protein